MSRTRLLRFVTLVSSIWKRIHLSCRIYLIYCSQMWYYIVLKWQHCSIYHALGNYTINIKIRTRLLVFPQLKHLCVISTHIFISLYKKSASYLYYCTLNVKLLAKPGQYLCNDVIRNKEITCYVIAIFFRIMFNN